MADGLQWIGLARRAGLLALGEENTRAALRGGKAVLVVVARDTSPGALKRAEGYVYLPEVPLLVAPYDKAQISERTGKPGCSMAAFLDIGLAAGFAEALREEFGTIYAETAEALNARRDRVRSRKGNTGKRRKMV